jgi:glycosyltransferase involved in cell wall biosynthesis
LKPLRQPGPAVAIEPPNDADVCLLLEGSYPFEQGGVSVWVDALLRAQSHLTFHLVAIVADRSPRQLRYELPPNVVGLTKIVLHDVPTKSRDSAALDRLVTELEAPLGRLLRRGDRADLTEIVDLLEGHRELATRSNLLNSQAAWRMMINVYDKWMPQVPFLDFFWSWRSLVGGLLSVLLAEIPPARLYHSISTGYAGLLLARLSWETGRPTLLSEHGIYTNERRVEIATAEWLRYERAESLDVERSMPDLRDFWMEAFIGYARACYQSCERIITLFAGNQKLQKRDGAPADRLLVIPNGVEMNGADQTAYAPQPHPPTVALIGRTVPIKDTKTFLRAFALLLESMPEARALLLGSIDQDPDYFHECEAMVTHWGLDGKVAFEGEVRVPEWFPRIDVVVLTSVSESQPLVLLEAGMAGIPCVASDVGSCREILLGEPDEYPPIGPSGIITLPASPLATAQAMAALLSNPVLRADYSAAARERVRCYYSKAVTDRAYRELYETLLDAAAPAAERA